MTDLAAIKGKQQVVWNTGDYSVLGSTLQIVSETLCEAVDLRGGQRVLDVATGSGNTAIAAARRDTDVTGVDYVPALLERARTRARAEGHAIEFVEGDAERLPFPDASFDVVLSTFGVMFAPDQDAAARELLRVTRPGGKIGLACWTPDGGFSDWGRVITRFAPPPAELRSPALWGTEIRLREMLGERNEIETTKRSFAFRSRSIERLMEVFCKTFGPIVAALAALEPPRRQELVSALHEFVSSMNRADDGSVVMPFDYLEIVVTTGSPATP